MPISDGNHYEFFLTIVTIEDVIEELMQVGSWTCGRAVQALWRRSAGSDALPAAEWCSTA